MSAVNFCSSATNTNLTRALYFQDHTSVSSIAVQNGTANGSSENVVSVQMLKKTTEKVQSTNVLGKNLWRLVQCTTSPKDRDYSKTVVEIDFTLR